MKNIKFLLSVIIVVFISTNLLAQDKIYLKDGNNIEAKILEVNVDNIKYKKFSNQEGPIFTIAKNEVQMLVYENGESEIFKDEKVNANDENNKATNFTSEKSILNGGGPKIGLNIGFPVGEYASLTEFFIGAEFAYLGEVAENFEIGGLIGYSYYFGGEYDDYYTYDLEDVGYIPIAFSSRYYFVDRKLFTGIDLGYAIGVTGSVDGGFYFRPKFGVNLGGINLIASYSSINEGGNYKEASLNFGIEFNLTR